MLVYAHRAELERHEPALRRLTALAEGDDAWALPVFCLAEFLRVVTHPRLLRSPSKVDYALAELERLLDSPALQLLLPGPRYPHLLAAAIRASGATGNLVFDAQIAALCLEHGVREILTLDRDFARFPDLRIVELEPTAG